jgi:hypothetical protein
MTFMTPDIVHSLKTSLSGGLPPPDALPAIVGGLQIADGLWRFYSSSWPIGGIAAWNQSSVWRQHWLRFLPPGLFCFGEDVFGNQLALLPNNDNVFMWNHENGECEDLLVGPADLLEAVLENGLDWIDFYEDASPNVARAFGTVPPASHLHWVTPLILGGEVRLENVTLVEREAHLVGHAQIWAQVAGLAPGTIVVPR